MRRVFTITSLLWWLCAATVTVWVWTYVAECRVWYAHPKGGIQEISSYEGSLYYHTSSARYKRPGWHMEVTNLRELASIGIVRGYAGHGLLYRRGGLMAVRLPLYLPLLLLAAGAIFSTRRRRYKAGTCPACGYNLTANTSGVCPECGTKIST